MSVPVADRKRTRRLVKHLHGNTTAPETAGHEYEHHTGAPCRTENTFLNVNISVNIDGMWIRGDNFTRGRFPHEAEDLERTQLAALPLLG